VGAKKMGKDVADATKKGAHEVNSAAKNVGAKTKTAVKGDAANQPDKKPAQ
jgi:hypothetical protein